MIYTCYYSSPVGLITIAERNNKLIGLWTEGQKFFFSTIKEETEEKETPMLNKTKCWLDRYFRKEKPDISALELSPEGSEFRRQVWDILCRIPYGETITYGEIAKEVALANGKEKMSAQAIGGAVGHNPISIIIPCHRVVGGNGNLTGYAGGIEAKIKLLTHEGVNMKLFTPKKDISEV